MSTLSKANSVYCHMPNPALPAADWGDCFEIEIHNQQLTAIEAAELALGRVPGWIRALMRLRNYVVSFMGLKPAPDTALPADQQIGTFPLVSKTERRVVLGLDDYHLDFRIVIDVRPSAAGGTIVATSTLVKRKNALGWIYLALVKPFHKIIVPAILGQGLRNAG